MDCTSNCLSKQHGNYLTSAFSFEDIDSLKTIIAQKCKNPLRISDSCGRTILHICSSVGRYDVLSWLFEEWKTANMLLTKDKESGWSSLHRSLYYGHIHCAILIYNTIQDWYGVDNEGHTPLDLVVLDSPRTKKIKKRKERLAVVVLPFESGEAGELTINCGDIVEILNTNRSGWAVGRLKENGYKGLFPFNFVEECKPDVSVEPCKRFEPINDVYTWGNNVNFALGLGDSKNRINPEFLDKIWLEEKSIKDCVVTKFHSVFLTDCGNIYTCGHGLGGRLGHGYEETVLFPKLIDHFKDNYCTAIAAASSHTVVLDEMGNVYTFGSNDFYQLGHHPPPANIALPKQITSKSLKNKRFLGVAAGRFHSVIYTINEIYTFGLNAGQLGHPQGDKFVVTPKLVTHLYKKEASITSVIASDGAIICLLANGDLYLFQDYCCRKIALRLLDISVIAVTGGVLKSSDLESFNKPLPLRIVVLHNSGVVEVWRSGFNSLKLCFWLGQKLSHAKILHLSLSRHLILTTDTGQVYFGHFLNKNIKNNVETNNLSGNIQTKKVEVQSGSFSLSEVYEMSKKERSECEEVNLVKVPLLYRCKRCVSDSKSRTFAAIQSDARQGLTKYPNVKKSTIKDDLNKLLTNALLDDEIHDAVIKLKSINIPVHKFILKSRLKHDCLQIYKSDSTFDGKSVFNLLSSQKDTIDWLKSIYLGEDTTEEPSKIVEKKEEPCDDIFITKGLSSLALADLENPLDDYNMNKKQKKGSSRKKVSAFSVHKEMEKQKDNMNENGKTSKKVAKDIISLGSLSNWKNQTETSDISIESDDKSIFKCHKCILTSRSDYFNNMLNSVWIESSIIKGGSLKIPIPGNILEVVLNFLYTDEADSLKGVYDISFIGEVLVCAEQLVLTRLKNICELELADKAYLKNALEIFQFACDYNAEQLKIFMCQFISLNLTYFLEAKLLETLSNEYLELLSKEYQAMVAGMDERRINPSFKHREIDELEKSVQESVTNEINKIKSRKGRLSSSRSKSVCSVGESDLDNSINLNQLSNDVFEERSPNCNDKDVKHKKNIITPEKVQPNGVKVKKVTINDSKSSNGNGHFPSLNGNGVKSPEKDTLLNKEVWNVGCNQNSHQNTKSGMVSPTNDLSAKKKGISPFKKKSQKDRKKGRLSSECDEEHAPNKEVKEEKPACPWAKPSLPAPQVSLRAVMSEEKPSNETQPKRKSRSFQTSLSKVEKKDGNPWRSPKTSECHEPGEAQSFTKIVDVQQEEKKQLTEQSKKPLSVIQLEEKAIEELMKHYEMVTAQGEYITIKRIKPVVATPFWEVDINQ